MVNPKMNVAYAFTPHSELYLDFGEQLSLQRRPRNDLCRRSANARDVRLDRGTRRAKSAANRSVGEEVGYRYSAPTTHDDALAVGAVPSRRTDLRRRPRNDVAWWSDAAQRYRIRESYLAGKMADARRRSGDLDRTISRRPGAPGHRRSGIAQQRCRARRDRRRPRLRRACGCAISARGRSTRRATASLTALDDLEYPIHVEDQQEEPLTFDMFNMFNANVPDVTYYYNSWLPYDAKNPANANNPAINPALGANIEGALDFPAARASPTTTFIRRRCGSFA